MKVILQEEVRTLGRVGDVVSVSRGYARNFLFPRNVALPATAGNVALAESLRRREDRRQAQELSRAQEEAAKIAAVPLTFERRAGEDGRLFGSVTANDIALALAGHGIEVDKRRIELAQPLDSLGDFEVTVKLSAGVSALARVTVSGRA